MTVHEQEMEELRLQLGDALAEVRRLKAQIRERERDYAKALKEVVPFERVEMDMFEAILGAYAGLQGLYVHKAERCSGDYCCIHNPSWHPLRDAPLQWRADRGLMERRCACGIGHPDPDDLAHKRRTMSTEMYESHAFGVHGCCGCCHD